MSLTNSQYDQIMRIYEQRQIDNEHRLREHYREAYARIPSLKEVDQSISSLGMDKARRLLEGDLDALASLKQELARLTAKKLTPSYRRPVSPQITWSAPTPAPTAGTPVTSARKNATVSGKQ